VPLAVDEDREMTLATIAGQPRAVGALKAALAHKTVHHAYLFAGPPGVGKEDTARALAQALLCLAAPDQGCGACDSCQRVARLAHPDLAWVLPEAEQVRRGLAGKSDFDHTPSREIRVEQIRALQERLSLRPLEGTRRVALILDAQEMNEKAQNAFLKTLEEPPSGTTLILVASAPERLLVTLRSRCSRVQFGPLPFDLVARRVQEARKVDEPTSQLLARMSGGSLSEALGMDLEQLAKRRVLFEDFEALSPNDWRGFLRFAEEVAASRDEADATLAQLSVWTRDVLLAQEGETGLVNVDLLELAQASAARRSSAALHRRYQLIEETRTALTRNGAPRVQVEALLLRLGEDAV
jgi:DNA polymerase-3 subunit delta'